MAFVTEVTTRLQVNAEPTRSENMRIKDLLQFAGWEIFNKAILKLHRRRRYRFDPSLSGVNLGCGLSNPPGWLGIDGGVYLLMRRTPRWLGRALWRFFNLSNTYTFEKYFETIRSVKAIHHDLLRSIPLDDDTVPAIYSSHFLEHLFKPEAAFLLRESYRVLRPGGIMRICVPSLDLEIQTIKNALLAYEHGDVEGIQPFVTHAQQGFSNRYSGHKHMYNFSELERALLDARFTAVSEKAFGVGSIRDVVKLDTREGLFVEAIKPEAPRAIDR